MCLLSNITAVIRSWTFFPLIRCCFPVVPNVEEVQMMEDQTNDAVNSNKESDNSLIEKEGGPQTVEMSNKPENTVQQELGNHLQKTEQGSREIESLELLDDGAAGFTNKKVADAESIPGKEHQKEPKPKRSRKMSNEENNDELDPLDNYEKLPQSLKHTLENGVMVSVYQGDITEQHVDVIVNAANERLMHGGGVAGAIVRKGGQVIQKESRKLVEKEGIVAVGEVAHTGAGHLPCKRIIHAVGPQWRIHGPERSRELIYKACLNSFIVANQLEAGSIALPGISSGIFGVPREICAKAMFSAAEDFSEKSTQNALKDIRFVNIDAPTNNTFRQEFRRRYLEKPESGSKNEQGKKKDSITDNQTKKEPQTPSETSPKGSL